MSMFGWSYPAGAENDPLAPYNQDWDDSEDESNPDTQWTQITKRTNDPKLTHFQSLLQSKGIASRRHGESFHGPILQVPVDKYEEAMELLSSDVFGDGREYDEIEDDDTAFS